MKRVCLAVLACSILIGKQDGAQQSWQLHWSDEFNGPANAAPDMAKWVYDLGANGWGNNELQEYTQSRKNSFQDGKGHLVIRAVRSADGKYTSARLKTLGKSSVKYGKVEARLRTPYGEGIWPAFWMLGTDIEKVDWPNCGEIDVMENIGKEPLLVHGSLHGPGYSGKTPLTAPYALKDGARFADDFHVFGVEWEPEEIRFFVDGNEYYRVTPKMLPQGTKWVYDHPFFLLLNVAVGGSWPGSPDARTKFPQEMSVDWVRVWERK